MSNKAIDEAVRRRLARRPPHKHQTQRTDSGASSRCACGRDVR